MRLRFNSNPGLKLVLILLSGVLLVFGWWGREAWTNFSGSLQRPRIVNTTEPNQTGRTLRVAAGGNFQSALNEAQCGDTIVLEAGASFLAPTGGSFVFPLKTGSSCKGTEGDTITVTTSGLNNLPEPGKRVGINHGTNMPKLLTAGPFPAISFAPNSKFWKLVGLEVTTTPRPEYVNFLIFIGTDLAIGQVPSDITFDRCYIHSREDGTNNAHATARAGVDVHAARVTFNGCRIAVPAGYSGASKNSDTNYAILMGKGPGPLTIENCELIAWYSCLFIGGSDLDTTNVATVRASPAPTLSQATLSNVKNLNVNDLIAFQNQAGLYEVVKVTAISGDTVSYRPFKGFMAAGSPLSSPPRVPGNARWNGSMPGNIKVRHSTFWINPVIAAQIVSEIGQYPKNFFENKSCDGLEIEACEFTGYPTNIDLAEVKNQRGPNGTPSPWATIRNVKFNNCYYHPDFPYNAQLFGIVLEDGEATSSVGGNISITNSLFTSGGWLVDLFAGDSVSFRHITVLNAGTGWAGGALAHGHQPTTNFKIVDSIIYNNEYGMHCQPPNDQTSTTCWPQLELKGNVLITRTRTPDRPNCANAYGPGNSCPSSESAVGFIDAARGDYRLRPDSPFKRKATDGTDPGVNMDVLQAALNH